MKLYVARHGQVATDAQYHDGDFSLPKGEIDLSPLGREQATHLGKFLKKRGFRGPIYASPLMRTMETAEQIAKETGSVILPTPWMHEIFADQDYLDTYCGATLEQLRLWYPHTAKDAVLNYPWWPKTAENHDLVYQRVCRGIDGLLQEFASTDEEILLLGHGASTEAAYSRLGLKQGGIMWNCCLGMHDSKDPSQSFGKNISFLPGQLVSANLRMALDYEIDEACQTPFGVEIPQQLLDCGSFKLLHIGDTHSATYSFYRQLIRLIKPDAIVHTGDTADEDKVGCDPTVKVAYLQKAAKLSQILKETGCPVYWIPGNNDLPEEIARIAPFFKITAPGTVLDIQGIRICVAHARQQLTGQGDFCLYGHAANAGMDFQEERISMGPDCQCLNAMHGVFVLTLPEKEVWQLERPD